MINLGWIDGFVRQTRQYVLLRKEDDTLIIPPNRVYKLNPTAFAMYSYLLSGRPVSTIPGLQSGTRAAEIDAFFRDLKAVWEGENPAGNAMGTIPFDFSFTRLPVLAEIAVTYRCNNRCLFCYAGCGNSDTGPEMSLSEMKKIIRIFRSRAKIPFFSFTGGEPLLRTDLEKAIRFARKLGLTVNLVSNGTLVTRERALSLAKAGLQSAQISIEASDSVLHDELTARTGSFKAAIDGIRNLQAVGIPVQTNTTITTLNRDAVCALPEFLAGIGVKRFAMNLFIPTGASPMPDSLLVPYSEAGEVVERVRREAKRHGLTFYWYSPLPFCHFNSLARGLGNKSCAAMDGLLSVTPAGDVLPCSSYSRVMGNLLTQDFDAVWFSPQALHFKEKKMAPEACQGCDAFTSCQGACPLYWDYVGTDEIIPKHSFQEASCE